MTTTTTNFSLVAYITHPLGAIWGWLGYVFGHNNVANVANIANVDNVANVNQKIKNYELGESFLDVHLAEDSAERQNRLALVRKHIENGADVNAIHINVPMLMSSLDEGNFDIDVLKMLINAGADVHATSEDGANALLWLVEGHGFGDTKGGGSPIFSDERIEAIKLFISHGVDPHVMDNEGVSAYTYSEYTKKLFDSLLV